MCRHPQLDQEGGWSEPPEGTVVAVPVAHAPALVPPAFAEASTDSRGLVALATHQLPTQQVCDKVCHTERYARGLKCPRLSADDKETAARFPGNVHNLSKKEYARKRRKDMSYDLPYWSAPAIWYWQMTGEDWDFKQESLSREKTKYTNVIMRVACQKQRARREKQRKEDDAAAELALQLRLQEAEQNLHQEELEALPLEELEALPTHEAERSPIIQERGPYSPNESD